MDFGAIFGGIGAAGAVIALIAGGKVRIVIGFASWVARKVGRFFDDRAWWADRYYDHQVDQMKDGREPLSMREFKRTTDVRRP